MSERFADRARAVEGLLASLDPRLSARIREAVARPGPVAHVRDGQTLVIAGHRAAGKTRILPWVSALVGRAGLDLDAELERRSGRALRTWVAEAPREFRASERACFESLPPGGLVAVGGGFLSHHPESLEGCFTVLVPVSFETYVERLRSDTQRPRLRPELSLEEELGAVFEEREALHACAKTVAMEDFLRGFASAATGGRS